MPGMNLIYSGKGNLGERKVKILQALDGTIHHERFFRELFCEMPECVMGCVRYEEYPMTQFDNDDFVIVLEGRIYNRSLPIFQQALLDIAQDAFIRREPVNEKVTSLILQSDGDYVVYIVHKATGECLIFNDVWGRLPLYYATHTTDVYVARDLRFITNLLTAFPFNRISIAQYLILGYNLGERTIYENIHRIQPATLLQFGPGGYVITALYKLNVEANVDNGRTLEQNAQELAARFSQACKNRLWPGYTNLLSMSGGFDSRAVGAAFYRSDIPFQGATFVDFDKSALSDARIAGKLAQALHVAWKCFDLDGIQGKDVLRLLRFNNGISPLVLSMILPFFEKIRETWGSKVLYFTGDGGDKALPELRPLYPMQNMDDLIRYTLYRHHHFNVKQAATLTNLTEREIADSLRERFEAFPEESLDYRYAHFFISERSFKWLFASEDRNRCYFWTVTPFFSNEFFFFSMTCPADQKAYRQLYGRFIHILAPEATTVEDQNSGQPINTWKYRNNQRLKNMLIRVAMLSPEMMQLSKQLAGRVKIYPPDAPVRACIADQLRDCEAISEVLSASAIKAVITDDKVYSKACLQHLLTITSAIEDLGTGRNSIENYLDVNLV